MSDVNIFAIVPIEVMADRRLTLNQMRVLIAIFSFRNKATGIAFPSREQLSERCGGMALSRVSTTTTELCELGWLEKDGKGGKSRSSVYTITVPESFQTVTELVTVTDSVTVTELVTQTVTDSVTFEAQTVTELVTGIEQTINTNRQSNRQNITQSIFPDGFPAQLKSDFEKLRKAKRAPITKSALDGISKQAAIANITLEAAIQICCERGWQSFNADWLQNSQGAQSRASPSNGKQAARDSYAAQAAEARERIIKNEHNSINDITGQCHRVA